MAAEDLPSDPREGLTDTGLGVSRYRLDASVRAIELGEEAPAVRLSSVSGSDTRVALAVKLESAMDGSD